MSESRDVRESGCEDVVVVSCARQWWQIALELLRQGDAWTIELHETLRSPASMGRNLVCATGAAGARV